MLKIRLLGQFNLEKDGEPIELPSRPARTLLAYLLLTRGTHHPRARLAGLLWPDSSENRARKNLRQALWQLRKAIGDTHLLSDSATIAFERSSDVWLDVGLLEESSDLDPAPAVAAYAGELLPGHYEDWILLERDRLAAAYDRKVHRLLKELIRDQKWARARDWAERWIAQGQVPEAAYRTLMLAHAAEGNRSGVQSAYRRCIDALQQEVGVDPSDGTTQLYQRLMSEEGLPGSLPGLEADEPTALATRQIHLPAQPTPFIGRKRELAEIGRMLQTTRLLTLIGPGGIGKTRLALKLAKDSVDQYRNGVHFVPLASIHAPERIVQTVADGLEFPLSSSEDPLHQLLGYLRHRQLMLLMDNFEHLLDGAVIVSEILQTAPAVKVLATSRERLGLRGELTVNIEGLDLPELGAAKDIRAHDSIELFLSSAGRAQTGFQPSAEDLQHAAQVCQIVEGMPLAIELASAWLDTLSVAEIAAELQRDLSLLSTAARDVPDRHRNIRAVFDHSWSLIGTAEREVFAALSIFRGGFTREAAQQVAGASLELLAGLVRKSFVRHDPSSGRFEIHELLRQYGQRKLEKDAQVQQAVRNAHAAYFADFMHDRWDHLKDGRQLMAIREIEADIDNLRSAWRHLIGQREAAQIRRCIRSLYRVYFYRGWNFAAVELFAATAEAMRGHPNDEQAKVARALALSHQAFFMAWQGRVEEGLGVAKQGVEILKQSGVREELQFALDALALNAFYLGRFEEHRDAGYQILEIASEREDPWRTAYARFLLSIDALRKQEHEKAQELAEESLKISEQHSNWLDLSLPLLTLGHVATRRAKYAEARDYYLRALEIDTGINFRFGVEKSIKYLGEVALATNEIAEAERLFLQSLQIAEEIGLGGDLVNLIHQFARVRLAQGEREVAVELLALVAQHPASRQAGWGEERIQIRAQRLLEELESQLPAERFSDAVRRGEALELEEVVASLLTTGET